MSKYPCAPCFPLAWKKVSMVIFCWAPSCQPTAFLNNTFLTSHWPDYFFNELKNKLFLQEILSPKRPLPAQSGQPLFCGGYLGLFHIKSSLSVYKSRSAVCLLSLKCLKTWTSQISYKTLLSCFFRQRKSIAGEENLPDGRISGEGCQLSKVECVCDLPDVGEDVLLIFMLHCRRSGSRLEILGLPHSPGLQMLLAHGPHLVESTGDRCMKRTPTQELKFWCVGLG